MFFCAGVNIFALVDATAFQVNWIECRLISQKGKIMNVRNDRFKIIWFNIIIVKIINSN